MVGRNRFQTILITFLWHKMQETSPRAMLQAIKIEIGGRGVPHGCAQMGKNDHNPKIGYALLMVGRREFLRVFLLDIKQDRKTPYYNYYGLKHYFLAFYARKQ